MMLSKLRRSKIGKHWKWLVILVAICLTMGVIIGSGIGASTVDIAKAYADDTLYENALSEVYKNELVIKNLGVIKPIDKMAILEGFVAYSDGNKKVKTTVRIHGEMGRGKLDIEANKKNGIWEYQIINVRLIDPKRTINVLKLN